MAWYDLLKWLHVLSAAVLFGTGIGTAFHMWLSYRRGTPAEVALAARNTVLADWLFTLPAGIAQPLTGVLLASVAGWPLAESWLVAAYLLYALAFACWAPVVAIQIEVARLAARAARDGGPLPDRLHRRMRLWFGLGWPAFLALLLVFWLMIAKPALW